jgi:hypothetical protein
MPRDSLRMTSPAKLHNRPACLGDVRRAFNRGYVATLMPVARRNNVASKYIPIAEICNETRGSLIDVRDPWSLFLHKCLVDSLLAEHIQIEVIPTTYPPGKLNGTPYVWVYLGFAPDRDHPDERWLGCGCGPDPLSALLRALSDLPERSALAKERSS